MKKAELFNDRVIIWEAEKSKDIFEDESFGRLKENRLELALIEAALLLENGKIQIYNKGKKISQKEFFKYCSDLDSRFEIRYIVFKDLRDKRGLPVRTGFKFGCDFRVYEKGVKPLKRGPKAPEEHTKWIVFAVPEGYTFSFPELSRAVRLAHNIRANMLWAVVSGEKVDYYSVQFFKP